MSWEQGDCSSWKRPNWHGPCEHTSSHTTRDTGRRHMTGNLWILCGAHSGEAGWGVGRGLRLCPFSSVSTNSFPRVPNLSCAKHSDMSMYYPEYRLPGPLPSISPSYSHTASDRWTDGQADRQTTTMPQAQVSHPARESQRKSSGGGKSVLLLASSHAQSYSNPDLSWFAQEELGSSDCWPQLRRVLR